MLRKEDDIKIKCLKEPGEMEADTVKCNWDKEKRKRNSAIREKGRFFSEPGERSRGERYGGGCRDEGERARREQTLMPPCRPQMLHQLQTSSFLRSPSFPSSRASANREGETRRHMPYSNLPHPVAFTVLLPLSPRPSSFHSHLSAVSQPAPGAMTLVIRRRKEGRRDTR